MHFVGAGGGGAVVVGGVAGHFEGGTVGVVVRGLSWRVELVVGRCRRGYC